MRTDMGQFVSCEVQMLDPDVFSAILTKKLNEYGQVQPTWAAISISVLMGIAHPSGVFKKSTRLPKIRDNTTF